MITLVISSEHFVYGLTQNHFSSKGLHALPLTNILRVHKIIYRQRASYNISPKIDFGLGMAISVTSKPTCDIDHRKPVANGK